MIKVTFENIAAGAFGLADFRSENVSFTVEGHSQLGAGSDIYCAGVSAVVQSCVASLSKIGIDQKLERREGYLKSSIMISVDSSVFREARAIIGMMMTGVGLLASLPGSNIEIFLVEV